MSFTRNPPAHFLEKNNVGGIVALPPTSCLRAACLSAYAAAHVECTGTPRRRHFQQIGPLRWTNEICRICPEERFL